MIKYLKELALKDSNSSSKRAIALFAAALLSATVGRILFVAKVDALLILASMLISFILALLGITVVGDNRRRRIENQNNKDESKKSDLDHPDIGP